MNRTDRLGHLLISFWSPLSYVSGLRISLCQRFQDYN